MRLYLQLMCLWVFVLSTAGPLVAQDPPAVPESQAVQKRVPKKSRSYQHQLAVCAIFRNEARFLKEWLEFHKLMGVTHFYLYNHLSTDDYHAVLAPYLASGEVELEPWPFNSPTRGDPTVAGWTLIQTRAYQHALNKARGKVKWLAILDTDEFLYPVVADNLTTFLSAFEEHGGVVAHWQLFGTAHVQRIPDHQLMLEMLTLKAPDDYAENKYVKSIVRPERVATMTDPHIAHYRASYHAVNQNGHPTFSSKAPIVIDQLRINHYWSRDEDFFYTTKVPRRQAWQEGLDGQLRRLEQINQVEDHAIQRFVPALKAKLQLPSSPTHPG